MIFSHQSAFLTESTQGAGTGDHLACSLTTASRWLTWRAALPAAAAALTLTAGLIPAQAASTPAWSISEVLGAPSYAQPQALSVSGPDNAWVSGTSYQSLLAEHWDGTQWTSVTPPPSVDNLTGETVNDAIVGSSSPTNMWSFPQVSGSTTTKTLGLVWNGSTWSTAQVPATDSLLGVNVIVASGASVVSASDMWAAGPTTATAGKAGSKQVYIAMHWNGKTWSAVRLPKLAPVSGAAWEPRGIAALGGGDVWIAEVPQGSLGGEPGPQDTMLLHWNGHTWKTVAEDRGTALYDGITGDGHGGLWLAGSNATTPAGYLVHYSGGTFTSQAAPSQSGYYGQAGSLTQVPGSPAIARLPPETFSAAKMSHPGPGDRPGMVFVAENLRGFRPSRPARPGCRGGAGARSCCRARSAGRTCARPRAPSAGSARCR